MTRIKALAASVVTKIFCMADKNQQHVSSLLLNAKTTGTKITGIAVSTTVRMLVNKISGNFINY